MHIPPSSKNANLKSGFTMIEIAIAVGVIGFALVAIIGILPRGMSAQKDNREDTIISEDAPYFLSAIRNGEQRTNNNILTGYVESVSIVEYSSGPSVSNFYANSTLITGGNELTNDMTIVGLLSTSYVDNRIGGETNVVTAIVRGMSGSAMEQSGANSVTAFRYQMTVESDPVNFLATNYPPLNLPQNILTNPAAFTAYTNYLANNLHEVRLKFAWPILPNGNVGPNRQTYRTLISGHLSFSNAFFPNLWFFSPNNYTNNVGSL